MSHPLWEVRRASAEAIRRCEEAERQNRQALDTAQRKRQAALADVRQKHTRARQEADTVLQEVRRLAQQGDRILAELGLSAAPPPSYSPPPGASPDALTQLLHQQYAQAKSALNRLRAAAEALKEERRKWWKFW